MLQFFIVLSYIFAVAMTIGGSYYYHRNDYKNAWSFWFATTILLFWTNRPIDLFASLPVTIFMTIGMYRLLHRRKDVESKKHVVISYQKLCSAWFITSIILWTISLTKI